MKKLLLRISISLFASFLMAGCAKTPTSKNDPYEGFNRMMYSMNMGFDKMLMRPVATAYSKIVPHPLQKGITNFFANLDEITTFPNDILQGKFEWAMIDIWRFVLNSTAGLGGLIDVATRIGIPKHHENFGMTLAYWAPGKEKHLTYVILPLLGPTTFRAAFGRIVDTLSDPITWVHPRWIPWAKFAVKAVNHRAQLLPADKLLAQAFDPYVFIRNAYLQNRKKLLIRNEMRLPKIPNAQPENFGQYNVISPVSVTPDQDAVRNGKHDVHDYNAFMNSMIYGDRKTRRKLKKALKEKAKTR